ANILHDLVEPACTTCIAALPFRLLLSANGQQCLTASFPRIHARSDQIGNGCVEVEAQFLVELRFHFVRMPEALPPVHCAPPSDIFRINPTAVVKRRQLAASASSFARPLRVKR